MEWRMERQAPFLKSVLQEANQHKRQELLRMANADQINAISEHPPWQRAPLPTHDYVAQTPYSDFTSHGQTRAFRQTTTRHHDGSKRGCPLA